MVICGTRGRGRFSETDEAGTLKWFRRLHLRQLMLWLGDYEVSVHLKDADCAHDEDKEIPYQTGYGYIVCEHVFDISLKTFTPLNETEDRSPQC